MCSILRVKYSVLDIKLSWMILTVKITETIMWDRLCLWRWFITNDVHNTSNKNYRVLGIPQTNYKQNGVKDVRHHRVFVALHRNRHVNVQRLIVWLRVLHGERVQLRELHRFTTQTKAAQFSPPWNPQISFRVCYFYHVGNSYQMTHRNKAVDSHIPDIWCLYKLKVNKM